MRRLMKFMHTMGAIGLMGAMACLLVLLSFTPAPASLSQYALMRAAMGGIATWIFRHPASTPSPSASCGTTNAAVASSA